MANRKRGDYPETEGGERSVRRKTKVSTSNVYGRPASSTLTPYANQFGPSDYELFNQVLSSTDLSIPRMVKSGLTPEYRPLDGPLLTPITHAKFNELNDYQRQELTEWTALELSDIEAIEGVPLKPNNLSNELHPVLDKPRWRNPPKTDTVATYHLSDGTPVDIDDPDIWSHLVPSLKLASQFISNFNIFEWWDALWEGRREDFTHPNGPRYPKLTRFFKRSEQERLENPVKLEKHLHDITWELGIGKFKGITWEGLTCGYSSPVKPVISISGTIFEPLLFTGAKQLTVAQRLAQDFYIASTVLHELAHSVGYIRNESYSPLPPEIGNIKNDPRTIATIYDRTPESVEELIKFDCYKGEKTEQEAHRAFRKRWTGLNFSKKSEEELEELLRSRSYWSTIRQLRQEKWFAPTGSNIYNLVKQAFAPNQQTEEYITCEIKDRLLAVEGILDDHMTSNDFIAAILQLRSERFFTQSKLFLEQYYMDEDVSEHGFSATNSVLGGQLIHNPRLPRDALHRRAIKNAAKGFDLDLPDIDKELGEHKAQTFYNIFVLDYPIYAPGCERYYNLATPVLKPEKFNNPAYDAHTWPVPLHYMEEIQQDEFWKVSCSKWGGEMVRINPRYYSRRSDGTRIDVNASNIDFLKEIDDNNTEEGKYRTLKRNLVRRVMTRYVLRHRQNQEQIRAIDLARIDPIKKTNVELFLSQRKSEKMAFYGNLVGEMYKERQLAKELEVRMEKFSL